jgi:predicted nuclease of restriction endonuclease-like RecB superfamily
MFSTSLLRFESSGKTLEPSYLDQRHAPLVRLLLGQYEAFSGRPYHELQASLGDNPEIHHFRPRIVAGLRRVIEESVTLELEAAVKPKRLRSVVFALGRREIDLSRNEVFERAGRELGLPRDEAAASLYADLKSERRVRFSRRLPDISEIISRYNFRLLQGILLHSESLRVELHENLRAAYRAIKLHGLLIDVKKRNAQTGTVLLEITGPLALFKKTRKYGYALARCLPACCVSRHYRLEAQVNLNGKRFRLSVSEADRLLPSHRLPREFDSRLEQRFSQDFTRLNSDWDLSREGNLIVVDTTVFLPDFTFRLKSNPAVRVDLEIVGFWTRDYLARKMAIGKRLGSRRVIFCVDEKLCCDREASALSCIFFKRKVPAKRVLQELEARREEGLGSPPLPKKQKKPGS